MRIALFTDGIFPYVIGGMQKHSFYLAKYLAKNKVYVDLYHYNNNSELNIFKLELFSEEEKKYIRSFPIEFPKFYSLPGHYIRESYEYSKRIFDVFKKNSEVDFVYAKGFSGWKLIQEKKNGFHCAPIGVKFHGLNMFQPTFTLRGKVEQYIFRSPVLFNMKNADFVFSYGGKITEIIKKVGISTGRIVDTPAGIMPSWINSNFTNHSNIKKFVFIGRYERLKGIEELNSAIKSLLIDQSFEINFIGPIPENKKIIAENIHYLGQISDAEKIKSILQECDVLVCPSFSEGMPNVILEAMAQGLAIIATNVGAVSEMVSNKNGWLINPGSKSELKTAMMQAIHISPEKLFQLKTNSVEKVKNNFLWDKIILELIDKISKIVNESI